MCDGHVHSQTCIVRCAAPLVFREYKSGEQTDFSKARIVVVAFSTLLRGKQPCMAEAPAPWQASDMKAKQFTLCVPNESGQVLRIIWDVFASAFIFF